MTFQDGEMSGPGANPALGKIETYLRTVRYFPVSFALHGQGLRRRMLPCVSSLSLACSIALFIGCATVPEQKIVARVETLPPQKIAVTVLCVKASDIPPMPATKFDPKAEYTEQLSAQAQADIDELKIHIDKLTAIAVGCAKQEVRK